MLCELKQELCLQWWGSNNFRGIINSRLGWRKLIQKEKDHPVRTSSIPEDKNRSEILCRIPPRQTTPTDCSTARPLLKNIEAINATDKFTTRSARHQRELWLYCFFGRPAFLYGICSRLPLILPTHPGASALDSSTCRCLLLATSEGLRCWLQQESWIKQTQARKAGRAAGAAELAAELAIWAKNCQTHWLAGRTHAAISQQCKKIDMTLRLRCSTTRQIPHASEYAGEKIQKKSWGGRNNLGTT